MSKLDEKRAAGAGNSSILKFVQKNLSAPTKDENRAVSEITSNWGSARTRGDITKSPVNVALEGNSTVSPTRTSGDPREEEEGPSIDPEFLAALPDDIRYGTVQYRYLNIWRYGTYGIRVDVLKRIMILLYWYR